MKQQIAKLVNNGEYIVIRDSSQKVNPYRLYYVWRESGKYGLRERRKQLIRYGNLASCMYHLFQIAQENDKE